MNYIRKAKSVTGYILLQLLEMRGDNLIFGLSMALLRLISHKQIIVNNLCTSIPSYQ